MRMLPLLFLAACGTSFISGSDPSTADADASAVVIPCVEGDWIEDAIDTSSGACGTAIHAFGGPIGGRLELTVDGLPAGVTAWVGVETVGGDLLAAMPVEDGGSLVVDLPWSGEFLVRVTPDAPADFTLSRTCVDGCDVAWTRYPIFLMHGMAGTDAYVDVLDYFHQITDALVGDGYEVYAFAVDPFQISEVRSLEWAEHLDAVAAEGRHRGFNLIGHSQGGLDARYVAAHLDPEHRVASVLTIGTPHHGVPAADVVAGAIGGNGITQWMVDGAFDAFGALYGLDSDQDIIGQVAGFGQAAMVDWNAATPDRSDVYYASWAGKTCQAVDVGCLWDTGGEVVTPLLAVTHLLIQVLEGDNDGLVSVESAIWGEYYGALGADHLDEVGQIGGLTSLAFDHVSFFREEADYLRVLGF